MRCFKAARMASILIVDDFPDFGRLMVRLMTSFGYDAVHHTGGPAALEDLRARAAAGRLPALVILDLMMPEMSGIEVLRLIRANPRLSSIPVVIFSAAANERIADEAMDAGADDVWDKADIDFDRLRENVHRFARGATSTAAAGSPQLHQ
jgi:CheY-like chemotaxis protein